MVKHSVEALSEYHQEKLDTAQAHLESTRLSSASSLAAMTAELSRVWPRPVLYSSFRHVKVDPTAQFSVGDALVGALARRLDRNSIDVHHMIWETHPRGAGTIDMAYPTPSGFKVASLGTDLPNFTQWEPFSRIIPDLESRLAPSNWEKAKEQMLSEANGALSSRQLDELASTVDLLHSLYAGVLLGGARGVGTLTTRIQEFEDYVVPELGLPIDRDVLPTPYTQSTLARQINQTLKIVDANMGLESVLANAVDDRTAANLFVGGDANVLLRIGYSVKRSRFQASEYEARNPNNKLTDRRIVEKPELFDLLDKGQVVAAGIPAFISLIAASSVVPVAHLGSEYGTATPVTKALGIEDAGGYRQIVEDFRDCWAPIAVTSAMPDKRIRTTLTSVALWRNVYGLDMEEVMAKSLAQGKPVMLEGNV